MASDRTSPFAQIFGDMASVISLHYETAVAAQPDLTTAVILDDVLTILGAESYDPAIWPAGSAHRGGAR